MAFTYTILPDGSILKLDTPKDYVTAAQIVKDEAGDMGEFFGGDGHAFVSVSAMDVDE